MNETIGFLGLGRLGMPIAVNLLDSGYGLRVFNRTAAKAAPLVARGAQLVHHAAEAAASGEVVISVLWDDAALESVVTSTGFLERLGPNGVHISMSTVSPETARRMAALHRAHGSSYVEAPIFGRPEAAAARQLWIPIAGEPDAKARVRPLLDALGAQGVFDFGAAVGAATTVKLVGNFLIISAARSLHEALTLADTTGVDAKQVLDMLTRTLFPAPIYQNYGKMITEKQPVMQSNIPVKDLGLFEHTAVQASTPTPIASHLRELLQARS